MREGHVVLQFAGRVAAGAGALIVAACLFAPTDVLAQATEVTRVRALLEEADFEGALAAADTAEAGSTLARADLVALLETRVMIESGLRDDARVTRDLARLAALAPEPGPSFPPALARRYARATEGAAVPTLELSFTEIPTGVRIVGTPGPDPAGLVRSVRLHARTSAARELTETGVLEIAVAAGQTAQLYGELIGPGGAVLVTVGDATTPRTWRSTAAVVALTLPEPPPPADQTWLWAGIGIGAGAVVLGVVITVVAVTTSQNDTTLVSLPTTR